MNHYDEDYKHEYETCGCGEAHLPHGSDRYVDKAGQRWALHCFLRHVESRLDTNERG